MDKTQLTALLQFIKNAPDNDSLTATILRLAADSISLDTLKSLAGSKTAAVSTPQKGTGFRQGFRLFTFFQKGVIRYAQTLSEVFHLR